MSRLANAPQRPRAGQLRAQTTAAPRAALKRVGQAVQGVGDVAWRGNSQLRVRIEEIFGDL